MVHEETVPGTDGTSRNFYSVFVGGPAVATFCQTYGLVPQFHQENTEAKKNGWFPLGSDKEMDEEKSGKGQEKEGEGCLKTREGRGR